MKKKTFGFITVVALAIAAGWNYQQDKQDLPLSDLALENVEALADPEIEIGVPCIMTPQTCYEINDDLGHTVIPGYK